MTESGDLERLKKICRYGHIIMVVVTAVLLLAAAIMFVCAGIALAFPDAVPLDDLMLEVNGEPVRPEPGQVAAVFALMGVYVTAVGVTMMLIGGIMKAISREYTPFTESNVRRMKMISLIYVAMAAFMLASGLVLSDPLSDLSASFLPCLLVAVIVYCISLVFRYGMMLQKESDETLRGATWRSYSGLTG